MVPHHVASPALPAELIIAILRMVPRDDKCRLFAIRGARLVSRAWDHFLSPVLFQRATITLTKKGGTDGKQLHDLQGFIQLLQSSPALCSLIESLTIEDDHDVGTKSTLKRARCATDPALLRRTLSHLPHLRDLHLRHIFLPRPLVRGIHEHRGPRVAELRITVPGWDNGFDYAEQVAIITKNILSIFDGVDALRLVVGYEDMRYIGLPADPYPEKDVVIPYHIRSFTTFRPDRTLLEALTRNAGFHGLTSMYFGKVRAANVGPLLRASGATLTHVRFAMHEPFSWEEHPNPIDFSPCAIISDVTLVFHLLTNYQPRGDRMAAHVSHTLLTLLHRPASACPLSSLTVCITLNRTEPGKNDEWNLSAESMCLLEDALLALIDKGQCSSVNVQFDLQDWYHPIALWTRPPFDKEDAKAEADGRYERCATKCERDLCDNLPRLHQRGLMTVESLPVTLKKTYRDSD